MTDLIRRQMRQITLAFLCVIPASLILLTCSLLRRQGIPLFPIQNWILGSELLLSMASALIVIASGFYGVLLYRSSKTAAFFPLQRSSLIPLLGSLASFLAIASFSGSRYDYAAYQYQWSNILQGQNPWINLPTGPNAYGPVYNGFAMAYGLHEMLPKALFVILLVFLSLFLSFRNRAVRLAPLLVVLSPFSLSIVAVYGFMDVLPSALLVLSIYLIQRQSDFASGCMMAMSIFSKSYALLAIPIVILRLASDRFSSRVWRFAIGVLSVTAVIVAHTVSKNGLSFLTPVIWSGQREPSLFSIARVLGVEQISTYSSLLLPAVVLMTAGLFYYFRRRVVLEEYLLSLYCLVFAVYPLGHQQFALLLVFLLALVWSREPQDNCLSLKLVNIKRLIGAVLVAGLMSIQLIFESLSELKPPITSEILDFLSIVYPLLLLVVGIFYLMPYPQCTRES